MAAGQRKHNESYKKYRARLKNEEYALKIKLRGRAFWNSAQRGTYLRSMRP